MTNRADEVVFDPGALIAPLGFDDFFREHWERKPLHQSRGDAHYYDRVFTKKEQNRVPPKCPVGLFGKKLKLFF